MLPLGFLQQLGLKNRVVSIDKDAKTVTLDGGRQLQYDSLVSTVPLDLTLQWMGQQEWASDLTHR